VRRPRAVRDLAGRFEHRLFLSATPHNGHSNSFSTLLELLDPYRFTRGVKVRGRKALEDVMVRRLKEDIRATQGGFPVRRVERVVIDGLPPDAPELELSRLLDEYRTVREERHAGTSSKAQAAAGLLVVGLQQRLLSSVEAFARTLAVHRRTVERHWEQGQSDDTAGKEADPSAAAGQTSEPESPAPATDETHLFLSPPAADDERDEQEEDLIEAEEEAQIEAITVAAEADALPGPARASAELWRREQQLLDRMHSAASVWEIAIKHAIGKLPLPEPPAIYVPETHESQPRPGTPHHAGSGARGWRAATSPS
jgi:DNA-binding transcriptional regulator YiaG